MLRIGLKLQPELSGCRLYRKRDNCCIIKSLCNAAAFYMEAARAGGADCKGQP